MTLMIQLENITKRYRENVPILKKISVSVSEEKWFLSPDTRELERHRFKINGISGKTIRRTYLH